MGSSGFIFIDLETTGLDSKKDKIIEIGAIKVDSSLNHIDQYHTLVNPETHIHSQITALTHGLDDELVKDSPIIQDIKGDLIEFIGDLPLIAHNASFEEEFLRANVDKDIKNDFMDTMEFLAIFFPASSSLKLDTIIREIGLRPEGEKHRALEDAEDLYRIILYIRDKIKGDIDWYLVSQRILNYFRDKEWPWSEFVRSILPAVPPTEKPKERDEELSVDSGEFKFAQFKLDHKYLSSLITPPLEKREGQDEYIRYIVDSFNNDASLMIEAGTGTGKTIGYLLPAAQWAVKNSASVVISTKTKTLQQQIVENDIPLVNELLGIDNLKVVKVQGRNNYLCIRKIDRFFADIDLTDDFESKFSKLFFYSFDRLSGLADLTRIPSWVRRQFSYITRMLGILCAESSSCMQNRCNYYNDCHYFRMVRLARKAHIMIANHSLIMNWPAHLPKGDKIIFDEAHNLQKEATSTTTINLDSGAINNLVLIIYDVERGKGIVPALKKMEVETELVSGIETLIDKIVQTEYKLKEQYKQLFVKILSRDNKRFNKDYPEDLILSSPTIASGSYDLSRTEEWGECHKSFSELLQNLKDLWVLLDKVNISDEEYKMIIDSVLERIAEFSGLLEQVVALSGPDNLTPEFVFWLTWNDRKDAWAISRAFIDVGDILVKDVYPNYLSSIFTSATLKAGSVSLSSGIGFDRIEGSVISDDVISISSPFDYKNNSVMYFFKDSSDPWKNNFIEELSTLVSRVAELMEGKTLILFSSIKRMNLCYDMLVDILEPKGFKILKQGFGGDIVNYFMSEPKTILLGSESLGEGLDIKGEKLSCVILERMPVVIKTPVYLAREDLYKRRENTKPYVGFELPQRLLKLRQWSGRLIRSNSDKGTVIVYDGWFIRQKDKIQDGVIDTVSPMPVVSTKSYELIDLIKQKYSQWGCEL